MVKGAISIFSIITVAVEFLPAGGGREVETFRRKDDKGMFWQIREENSGSCNSLPGEEEEEEKCQSQATVESNGSDGDTLAFRMR